MRDIFDCEKNISLIFFRPHVMSPVRKEHSNQFRETIIKHFLNGDSEREKQEKCFAREIQFIR